MRHRRGPSRMQRPRARLLLVILGSWTEVLAVDFESWDVAIFVVHACC